MSQSRAVDELMSRHDLSTNCKLLILTHKNISIFNFASEIIYKKTPMSLTPGWNLFEFIKI